MENIIAKIDPIPPITVFLISGPDAEANASNFFIYKIFINARGINYRCLRFNL